MKDSDIKKEINDNIEKDIERCVRCGLCIQNCPIYDIKRDENNTCRGLICKLSLYKKGELTKRELKKNLKICLNCSKCKKNCPASLDSTSIFANKNALFYPSKFSQRVLLGVKLIPLKLLYFINFFKNKSIQKTECNTLYFKGCVARAQHKTTFLDSLYTVKDNLCCGLPYLTSGDLKNYNKVKAKNIELIKNAKKVVCDCASCKAALEEYSELSDEDRKKIVFFSDEIKNYKLKDNSKYKNKVVTFHKPCHLADCDFLKIEAFLNSIEGLNYKPLENPDKCCGFGGSYFMFHPIIAAKIVLKKAREVKASNADLILSACPSCVMGLRTGQIISFNFKKTLELRDFIDSELISD